MNKKKKKQVEVVIDEKLQVKGRINDKKNTLTDDCLADIVDSIYYNLCFVYVEGTGDVESQGFIELYSGETLVKSLPFAPGNIMIEDITNGQRITIQVIDDTTDEYTFDNLKLKTASSGHRMENPPTYYATASIGSTTKPADQSLKITWRIAVTKA